MTETLEQSSDAAWLAAKEDARAAVRRAGLTLLALAIQRAVPQVERVLDYVETHASEPPVEEADSPEPEADSPALEAIEAGRGMLAAVSAAADRAVADGTAESGEDDAGTEADADPGVGAGRGGLMGVLTDLLKAGLHLAADVVDRVVHQLEEIAAGHGVLPSAGLRAAVAFLGGKNPIWAAIKGGFAGLSPGAKLVVILALVLAIILLPVTVLLLLIVVIVVVIVLLTKTRSLRS